MSTPRVVFVRPVHPRNASLSGEAQPFQEASTHNGNNNNNNNKRSLAPPVVLEKPPPPVGLLNLGTTCYLNSILQCLFASAHFVTFIRRVEDVLPRKQDTVDAVDLLAGLGRKIAAASHALKTNKRALEVPQNLLVSLRRTSKGTIRSNRQEDAHEAMCVLLDMLQRALLTRAGIPVTTRVDGKSESTMVHTLFGGRISTTTTCPHCKHQSPIVDSFLQLSLELDATRKHTTLPHLVERMCRVERLDAKNMWQCDTCKIKVCAERQTQVTQPPAVLILHLKRFGFSFEGGVMRRTKLKNAVSIASEELVLPCAGNRTETYDLFGVLVHRGASVHSGHYLCFVKCGENSQFYETDDDLIRRVKRDVVLNEKEGYMFFYVKRSAQTTAFLGARITKGLALGENGHATTSIGEENGHATTSNGEENGHATTSNGEENGHVHENPRENGHAPAGTPKEPREPQHNGDANPNPKKRAPPPSQPPPATTKLLRRQSQIGSSSSSSSNVSSSSLSHNGGGTLSRSLARFSRKLRLRVEEKWIRHRRPQQNEKEGEGGKDEVRVEGKVFHAPPSSSKSNNELRETFSFERKDIKPKVFVKNGYDAWDKHLDKPKAKKIRSSAGNGY